MGDTGATGAWARGAFFCSWPSDSWTVSTCRLELRDTRIVLTCFSPIDRRRLVGLDTDRILARGAFETTWRCDDERRSRCRRQCDEAAMRLFQEGVLRYAATYRCPDIDPGIEHDM